MIIVNCISVRTNNILRIAPSSFSRTSADVRRKRLPRELLFYVQGNCNTTRAGNRDSYRALDGVTKSFEF